MAAEPIGAKVRSHDGVAVIDLSGEVNADAEAALDSAYEQVRSMNAPSVVLNFESVDYINSTGIALIVGLLARAKRDRCEVKAFGLTDHYRKIFEITRVSDFMFILPDEQSAVEHDASTA